MQIILTSQESESFFFDSLCNGLSELNGYGLSVDYKKSDYQSAKRNLREQNPEESICFEDVLMQILREGGSLKFIDVEGDGEYTRSISIAEVHARVAKTPIRHLVDQINENSDAVTADVILQTVLFEEVIFG
jgi:hypothetical protein